MCAHIECRLLFKICWTECWCVRMCGWRFLVDIGWWWCNSC